MYAATGLPLTAELLLLAHDPQTGRARVDGQRLRAALAGAAVVELVLRGVLALDATGRTTLVRATGSTTGLDDGLLMVLERAEGRAPKSAVARVGGAETAKDRGGALRNATWRLLESMGLARRHGVRIMGIIPVTRWVQPVPSCAEHIARRMETAVRGDADRDPRTTALVSICQASGLLRRVLPDLGRRQVEAWLAESRDEDWGGKAVARAIGEVQAAVVATVVISTVASTTTT